MPFNESGEIINLENQGREKTLSEKLLQLCNDALTSGNVLPPGIILDENVTLYYKPHHIDEMKALLGEIKKFSSENKIDTFNNDNNTEQKSVQETIEQIQRNIDFSEKINKNIQKVEKAEGITLSDEERNQRRLNMINKLRKNNG